MNTNLDKNSPISLGDQLQAHIRLLIVTGKLAPHDLLPTVQALAAATDTNYNTVAAAYRALEAQGYLTQRRRAGTRVAAEPPVSTQDRLAVYLCEEVAERIDLFGLELNDTLQLISAYAASQEVNAKAAPHVAVLAGDAERAASYSERAKALFGDSLVFVPVTLTSYRSEPYAATLIAPELLESLTTSQFAARERPPYAPLWPSTYDFPAGAD